MEAEVAGERDVPPWRRVVVQPHREVFVERLFDDLRRAAAGEDFPFELVDLEDGEGVLQEGCVVGPADPARHGGVRQHKAAEEHHGRQDGRQQRACLVQRGGKAGLGAANERVDGQDEADGAEHVLDQHGGEERGG
eukprot:scaffold10458_cov107-Isochrysis_galbana.AAC.2